MPRLVRQSARSADDRIGLQGPLVVLAVVAVVAGSLTIASKLDPLLRRFAPNPDNRGQRPPVVASVRPATPDTPVPRAAPVAPSTPAPDPAPAGPTPAPDSVSQSPTLPATVAPPLRRPTPEADEGISEEVRSAANRQRESRRQVARNARNARHVRDHEIETPTVNPASAGLGAYALVSEARRYIGTNPTSMARLWCARFMNYVLRRKGYEGTGSDAAMSFARYGRRVSGPRIGAIAVMRRKGGGHVGIVSGIDRHGNPILISGNTTNGRGRRIVAERVYPRRRIIAYVMPR